MSGPTLVYNPFTNNFDYTDQGSSPSGGIIKITGNSGSPVGPDSSGNLNLIGAGGISITPGPANTQVVTGSATGLTWNTVTSVSPANPIQISANNAYICTGSSQVTFLLPDIPNIGDPFVIVGSSTTFLINQNSSQQIRIGEGISTAGSGSAQSENIGDCLQLTYVGSNVFQSISPPEGSIILN